MASKTTAECQRSTHALLTDTSGYIGSSVTEETGCGTTETPWKVRAEPGQRLNFTLFDFAIANNSFNGEGNLGRGFAHCHVYVILKESEAGRSVTTCGGQERIKQIYTSTSNAVEIRVLTGVSSKSRYFVIKYEGKRLLSQGFTILRCGSDLSRLHQEYLFWYDKCTKKNILYISIVKEYLLYIASRASRSRRSSSVSSIRKLLLCYGHCYPRLPKCKQKYLQNAIFFYASE